MSGPDGIRRFWDERAEEDAFFFVDNRLEYGAPDLERFWQDGEHDLRLLLEVVGARVQPGDAVVDIGCGVGRLTRPLAQRAATVRALDVSPRMLDLAHEHNPELGNVAWLLGDGHSLGPVESASADACVSHVVFQHIADPAVTLGYVREIGRVLRPGGWAAFQLSNDPTPHRPAGRLKRLATDLRSRLGRGPGGQSDPNWRGSYTDLDELEAAAREAGLAAERIEGRGTQFCVVLLRKEASSA